MNYEAFLVQQNDRLKFYNDDFWETTKFFSALALLLISAPFAVWMKDSRPANWSIIASAAPLLAVVVSIVALIALTRTATSYYEVGASVVVIESLLKLHHFEQPGGTAPIPTPIPIVSNRRIAKGKSTVEELASEYKARLKGILGSSRMSVVLNLFFVYAVLALLEAATLLLHGFFGIRVVDLLRKTLV